MSELCDVYDKDRKYVGKKVERDKVGTKKNEYQLIVHICIFNSKGELLIQNRNKTKSSWPNLWDITAGGGAVAGESSQEAILRELYEELGINIKLSDIRPRITINFEYGFDDIYIIEKDISINTLKLQHSEVSEVKWASLENISTMIKNNEFMPYYEEYISLLFAIRGKMGVLKE